MYALERLVELAQPNESPSVQEKLSETATPTLRRPDTANVCP